MDRHVGRQSDAACVRSRDDRVRPAQRRFHRPSKSVVRIRPSSGQLLDAVRSSGACFRSSGASFRSSGARFRRPAAAERLAHGSAKARSGQAVEKEVGRVVGVVEKVRNGECETEPRLRVRVVVLRDPVVDLQEVDHVR